MSQLHPDLRTLRIGTRASKLALWQARQTAQKLQEMGYPVEIVHVSSQGDRDQTSALHTFGGAGVFTKALDEALMNEEIDLAVHSFKDLPTTSSLPIEVVAVLERMDPRDVLVAPNGLDFLDTGKAQVATGSQRRKAQWMARYPGHQMMPLRGNVPTRIQKITDQGWDGAIFAAAGLKRLELEHHITDYLEWMLPAPAQGAIALATLSDNNWVKNCVTSINHPKTFWETQVERALLNRLEAGCSAPVGAFARIDEQRNSIHLEAVALSLDGQQKFIVDKKSPWDDVSADDFGKHCADLLLDKGADQIIEDIKGT